MTTPEGYAPVDLPRDRAREVLEIDSWGFAFTPKEEEIDPIATLFDFARGRGVEIADAARGTVGDLAAVHSSLPYDMRVPGGTVPTSGLTWVAVHPAHRRRGLLTTMIHDHFARSLSRGEAVSTLYASESEIYQRFGYGLACPSLTMTLSRGVTLRDIDGADDLVVRLETATRADHADAVSAVQARMSRPGTMTNPSEIVLNDLFLDLESDRGGAEEARIAIVEDDEGPAAFAIFARKGGDGDEFGSGTVGVKTWGSAGGAATHRLVKVLSDLDLMAKTSISRVALDDPLVTLLTDLRGASSKVYDNLWVRILDIKASLESRTYAVDGEFLIEVTDPILEENAHVWMLSVTDGRATVNRAERGVTGHIRLGIQALSAAYLGGITLSSLAEVGLVEELHFGAVADVSRAFRSDQDPVSNISF